MDTSQRLSDLPAASSLSELAQVPVLQDGAGARTSVAQFRAGLAPAAHRHGLGDLPVASDGAPDPTALVRGDDARLSDARTPLAHNHGIGDLPVADDGAADHARLVRADDTRLSDARTPRTHAHALADLPVAADGVADAGKLVRSDDSRLSGGGGSGGGGFKNAVINGCCRVSSRSAKSLSGGWQVAAVDLLAVRADGSPSTGTLTQATGVTQLAASGHACLVQGAKLNGSGAVWWRHRLEARDAARFVNAAVTQSQASITTVHERTQHHGRVSCGFFTGLTSGAVLIQRGTGGTILASAEL